MTGSAVRRRQLVPGRERRGPAVPAQAGFTLVETVLAMVLFMVALAAALPFLVQALQAQSGLGGKQVAVTIAGNELEYIRTISPLNLLKGRNASDVAALTASPGSVDLSNDVTGSSNSDSAAPVGSANAVVPLTVTQVYSGVTYTLRNYVNRCYLSGTDGSCTASSANGTPAYRISLDVSWPRQPHVQCTSGRPGTCEYVMVSLIDPNWDPTFDFYGNPTVSTVNDATTSPVAPLALHYGQVVMLRITGTNFVSGVGVFGTLADKTAPVTSSTGTSISVQYQPSSTLGSRLLKIINPNGATATTTLTVTRSAPTVSAISPTSAGRNVTTTFTLTGTDLFAAPSTSTQTTKPTVSMSGSTTVGGSTVNIAPTISNVTVVSRTSLTFQAKLPSASAGYTANVTVTVTNPDGGTASKVVSMTAT